jgi:hypothetical protein
VRTLVQGALTLSGSIVLFLVVDGDSQPGRLRWICVAVVLAATPVLGRVTYLFEDYPMAQSKHGATLGFSAIPISLATTLLPTNWGALFWGTMLLVLAMGFLAVAAWAWISRLLGRDVGV